MSIIAWLIVGLTAGTAMGGRGFGVLGNIFVGIIGDFLVSTFHGPDVSGFNLPSIVWRWWHPSCSCSSSGQSPDPSHLNDSVYWRSGTFKEGSGSMGPLPPFVRYRT